ncbi:MAG: hypothetical protein LBR64_04225 [Dysgonamonadaceae bacterium]|jgi:hypothetical protein|nr:hypothetical protein [Dysgonamonadaceae bacterium]
MKAVFIPYNQAFKDRLIEMFDKMSFRGFTLWEQVQGRGGKTGEPHYGNHAWPTMNSAFFLAVPDDKVEGLLQRLRELDEAHEQQGLHAFVWNIETSI